MEGNRVCEVQGSCRRYYQQAIDHGAVIKKIETLIPDVYDVLINGSESVTDELLDKYALEFRNMLEARVRAPLPERKPGLRMSGIGKPNCQLWFENNEPEYAEPMRGPAYFKFLYGAILETIMLFLAEAAGHRVEGTQDEQEIAGVPGHRDAVIDGSLVDAKSASPYSYKKFENGTLEYNDAFGYIEQLGSYLESGQSDPLITDKDGAYFWAVDKSSGDMCLLRIPRSETKYDDLYNHKKEVIAGSRPHRAYDPIPDGKSGNLKLDTQCSYCEFKKRCHPNLRTFLYSNGPRFLTKVVKTPDVPEVAS